MSGIAKYCVYTGGLPFADANKDGLPDAGYGACAGSIAATQYVDATAPGAGGAKFYLVAADATSLGVTSANVVRTVNAPCSP